ncbi:sensor histidine kinase [Streptococcus sp. X13SY08]|nr:HAMP domain-containing sensor histidine kinase [Streptococcus sp. X13SY08]
MTAILVSLLGLFIFRVTMRNYIANQAELAIEASQVIYSGENLDQGEEESRLFAEVLELNTDYSLPDIPSSEDNVGRTGLSYYYYEDQQRLVQWASKNRGLNNFSQTKIGEKYYFVKLVNVHKQLLLLYVDASSEDKLVQKISFILLVSLAISLIGVGLFGLHMGSRLEKDQQKQKEFFENASHELKTPLMVIQGYADGLSQRLIPPSTASSVILQESNKTANLVDEILHLSRLENGSLKVEKIEFSLTDFLENLLYQTEFRMKKRGIRLETNISEATISANPQLLERAISNILSNSLRYAKTYIQIEADSHHIMIENDGPLLSSEDLSRTFDRFYIGKQGQSGIGMALTKEIIQQHGWKISAQNTENSVQFIITF